ncbi:SDR family NAD(P)-dependent oxidoreductase [Nocardioides zeae]|uniref:SDR family NAD(P)-dependent oxidoreductase n=1 Tax=Nocardioides imazamoxiresistens TaxID=3231893 RepID=A0ABU3PSN1_9ACTN|nr:SDR family NAD(P)-dependent oxidoreductase [Nocardioides zeae]MDT9592204.1 SDR family NAD(P)-dependent oxidoreductase [Nocardioides zeae]
MSARTALVTGASRGIGELVARRLAAEGFDLTISARSTAPLDELAAALTAEHGVRVAVAGADMSLEEDVRRLADVHRDIHGGLDLLVLNAGMGAIGAFADYPVRRLDKMLAINLRSAYVLTQELLPLLRVAGRDRPHGGRVIAVASTTGIVGEPLNSAYGATKAALISWCETFSTEESTGGVSATALCPGYVATAMTEGLAETVPQDQMLPPEDVAEALVGLTRLTRRTVVPQLVLTRPGPHLWRA